MTSYFKPDAHTGVALKLNLVDGDCESRTVSLWMETYNPNSDFYHDGNTTYTSQAVYSHNTLDMDFRSFTFGLSTSGIGITVPISFTSSYDEFVNPPVYFYQSDFKTSYPYQYDIPSSEDYNTFVEPYSTISNKNNVWISYNVYNNLQKLGFSKFEIDYMTQEEYNSYINYSVIQSIRKENKTSSYKDFILTVSKLSNDHTFIKSSMNWTTIPSTRIYDLIGISYYTIPGYAQTPVTINRYYGKQQAIKAIHNAQAYLNYTPYQNIYDSSLSSYFSKNLNGIVVKQNLINDGDNFDVSQILITLNVEISGSNLNFSTYYQHMTDSNSIDMNNVYINESGIYFNNSSYTSWYDGNYSVSNLRF